METLLTPSATTRSVHIISFGYGHDDAPTADVTADVRRWLPNPGTVQDIIPLDGRNPIVQAVVYGTPGAIAMADHLVALVDTYPADYTFVLAIGCAGGRHRSVALAERVAGSLALRGYRVRVHHRDVDRPVITRSPQHRTATAAASADLNQPPHAPSPTQPTGPVIRTVPAEPRRTAPERLYFEAPTYYRRQLSDPPAVFVGGGITGCPSWHNHVVQVLHDAPHPLVILNPKRAQFPLDDPQASWQQLSWEQHHLHLDGVTTMIWFPASDATVTVQPIAIFELGQALSEGRMLVVGADPDYPRAADIHMLCQLNRPDMNVFSSLDDVLATTIAMTAGDPCQPIAA